jgi:hypothetical protein
VKFKLGDAVDRGHSTALQHEFLRCQDAFRDFTACGTTMILKGENRLLAYHTYNSYSRFIQHLYEFLIGAREREIGDTAEIRAEQAELSVSAQAQRILTNRREAIQNGTAPDWENDISYYPERVPPGFAKEFRQYRNKVSGHVTHERSTLSLSEFYAENHKYLYMLYVECAGSWGLLGDEFPDLKEITDFSVLVKSTSGEPKNL